MILLALIGGVNCLLLIPDSLTVVHQACISKTHVVIDLTLEFVVRAFIFLVFLFSDLIMRQGFLVLPQVVITLAAMQVEES